MWILLCNLKSTNTYKNIKLQKLCRYTPSITKSIARTFQTFSESTSMSGYKILNVSNTTSALEVEAPVMDTRSRLLGINAARWDKHAAFIRGRRLFKISLVAAAFIRIITVVPKFPLADLPVNFTVYKWLRLKFVKVTNKGI